MEQVVKFDVTESWINEFKAQANIQLTTNEDTETYEVVKSLLKIAVSKRNEVEKKRKELNEDALKWQRTVNAEAKRITAMLEPIEEHLANQKSIYDEEVQRKKKAVLIARRDELLGIGFEIQNGILVNAKINATIHGDTLGAMTDIAYEMEKKRWQNEMEAVIEAEREAERLRQAEEQRLAEERATLERQRQEMEAQRLEFERIAKLHEQQLRELEEFKLTAKKAKTDARWNVLVRIGYHIEINMGYFKTMFNHVENDYFKLDVLAEMEEDEFEEFVALKKSLYKVLSEENERVKIERMKEEEEKKKAEEEAQKVEFERRVAEELERKQREDAERMEAERLRKLEEQANMKDNDLYSIYVKELLAITPPEMKTKTGKAKLTRLITLIKTT